MKLATLCYVKDSDKTLMLHRVKKEQDMHKGLWNGLGGKLEAGETPEECAVREVKEECGLDVSNPSYAGLLTFPGNKDGGTWYVFVFRMDTWEGELIESPEGNLEWVDDDKLLDLPLMPNDKYFLPHVLSGRVFSGKFRYEDDELIEHSVVLH